MQTVRRGLFCGQGYAITACRDRKCHSFSLALRRGKLSPISYFLLRQTAGKKKLIPQKVPKEEAKKRACGKPQALAF